MLSSYILDIIISVVVVYMLLAMLLSCLQEAIASIRKFRGKLLRSAIEDVLNDPLNKNYAYLLYAHPAIDYLRNNQKDLPSYIDSRSFASALVSLIQHEGTTISYRQDPVSLQREEIIMQDPDPYKRFIDGVNSLQYSDLKKLLLLFIQEIPAINAITPGDVDRLNILTRNIETWYTNYMDRVTGWYKRGIKRKLVFYSALLTVLLNINFISITHSIYADNQVRNNLVALGQRYTTSDSMPNISVPNSVRKNLQVMDSVKNNLAGLGIPIGWDFTKESYSSPEKFFTDVNKSLSKEGYAITFWGWIFSVIILSFGAPFWFDILKQLINIRNAGVKPADSSKN